MRRLKVLLRDDVDDAPIVAPFAHVRPNLVRDVPGQVQDRRVTRPPAREIVVRPDRYPGTWHIVPDLPRGRLLVDGGDRVLVKAEHLDGDRGSTGKSLGSELPMPSELGFDLGEFLHPPSLDQRGKSGEVDAERALFPMQLLPTAMMRARLSAR